MVMQMQMQRMTILCLKVCLAIDTMLNFDAIDRMLNFLNFDGEADANVKCEFGHLHVWLV